MSQSMKGRLGSDGIFYPYTFLDLVKDENGKSLREKLEDINAQLQKILKMIESGDVPPTILNVVYDALTETMTLADKIISSYDSTTESLNILESNVSYNSLNEELNIK